MSFVVVFPLVFLAMSVVIALFARAALLPLARAVQARYGFSDEFVTELSVGLPLIILILSYAGWLAWLWQ